MYAHVFNLQGQRYISGRIDGYPAKKSKPLHTGRYLAFSMWCSPGKIKAKKKNARTERPVKYETVRQGQRTKPHKVFICASWQQLGSDAHIQT